ncbi:hypothetical protein B9T10_05800 [Wohlfahrtiimonas chitiniclastica]|uniref:O-antigen translocase n=1 Tax=Wohlfahrtiimonas chitiniclastica TaxID=400946 RepID=UPI000B994308|nr:O-antigen translocase [Wohlfahrtiimonas chitiniclastica]OYQ70484.1 hypothetical protein B9T13_04290 [Wohlfahrtiimonas chitiniclastica]OYQ88804.1 hypothetical protein B9T10_05800 [Wohlfahrtiimonas chitiniclastica]
MKNLIQNLAVIKVLLLSSFSTAIKIISASIIAKLISIYAGPAGLGIFGQFQNISGIIQTFSCAGLNNGIIHYIAKDGYNKTLVSTIYKITIFSSCMCGLLVIIFSKKLSEITFQYDELYYIFISLGATLLLFSLNSVLMSIYIGLNKSNLYIKINIIQSIIGLFISSLLIYVLKIHGAFIAIIINQLIYFIIIYLIHRRLNLSSFLHLKLDITYTKKLLRYSSMSIVTVIALPLSNFIIRQYIITHLSLNHAGYWQAMNYISSMYLLVITTTLTIYYLPRLSTLHDKKSIFNEIVKTFIILLPISIAFAIFIFLSKNILINIFFSEEFTPILVLLKYQLLGDIIRIASCTLSYLMLAKAMTKSFIFTEILSSLILILLSIVCLNTYGFIGLSYAYFMSSICYFCMMLLTAYVYFSKINSYSF